MLLFCTLSKHLFKSTVFVVIALVLFCSRQRPTQQVPQSTESDKLAQESQKQARSAIDSILEFAPLLSDSAAFHRLADLAWVWPTTGTTIDSFFNAAFGPCDVSLSKTEINKYSGAVDTLYQINCIDAQADLYVATSIGKQLLIAVELSREKHSLPGNLAIGHHLGHFIHYLGKPQAIKQNSIEYECRSGYISWVTLVFDSMFFVRTVKWEYTID